MCKMKVFVVFLSLLVLSTAAPASPGLNSANVIKHAFTKLTKVFSRVNFYRQDFETHRVRRQSAACLGDILQFYSQKFRECNGFFQNYTETGIANSSSINTFCAINDCPHFMVDLLQKIIRDCPDLINSTIPDRTIQSMLLQSCARGPGNHYCVAEWNHLNRNSSTYNVPDAFGRCISEFDGHSCPNDCKTAEQWVINNLGCCYRAFIDLLEDEGNDSGVLTARFWDECSYKEPSLCMTPRLKDVKVL